MDMIERVARAIASENVGYNGPLETRTLEQRIDEEWEDWKMLAASVISATGLEGLVSALETAWWACDRLEKSTPFWSANSCRRVWIAKYVCANATAFFREEAFCATR